MGEVTRRLMRGEPVRRRAFLMCVILALVFFSCAQPAGADDLIGQAHAPVAMPEPGATVRGVRVDVQVGQQTVVGYLPVKITLRGTPVIVADRRLVIRFNVISAYESPPQNGVTIDVPVLAPEGARSETIIRYLPKWSAGQALEFEVLEDGRALEGYVGMVGGKVPFVRNGYWGPRNSGRRFMGTEYTLNLAFISEKDEVTTETMPDLRSLFEGPRSTSRLATWVPQYVLEQSSSLRMATTDCLLGQRDLPDDWRAYQRFDAIVLDSATIETLNRNETAMQAIRSWILNGGTAMVYNAESPQTVASALGVSWTSGTRVDENLDALAREHRYNRKQSRAYAAGEITQLNKAIRLATDAKEGRIEIGKLEQVMQTAVEPQYQFNPDALDYVLAEMDQVPVANEVDPEKFDELLIKELQAKVDVYLEDLRGQLEYSKSRLKEYDAELATPYDTWVERVQVRSVGAGLLIAIEEDPDRDTPRSSDWELAVRLVDFRASPMLRRGVDPLIGDRRFARWMIPGVAQPPVYTFMGLLTVFVILVGPVAYRRTSKLGRSYLMFVIAPVLALITTVAMFSYGIIADGFGTQVRVRQLTWVDGESGDAGERVRSTYFAGVRPADGLRFGGDVELMVYPEGTGIAWEDREELPNAKLGRVRIEADSQQLDASFLPSREQRQFVTHAPRHEIGFLRLTPDPDGLGSPSVENGFGFMLREAVMRDDNGVYWTVTNLKAGESRSAEPMSVRDASKRMGQLYNEFRPVAEVRESGAAGGNNWDRKIYDVLIDTNRLLECRVSVNDGGFENWLQRHMQTMGDLPDWHFVAICDVSPDVIAVDGCDLKASVRYVFGTMR